MYQRYSFFNTHNRDDMHFSLVPYGNDNCIYSKLLLNILALLVLYLF